jgi:hypothetical protein
MNIETAIQKRDWDYVITHAQNNGRFKGKTSVDIRIELNLFLDNIKPNRLSDKELTTSIMNWLY